MPLTLPPPEVVFFRGFAFWFCDLQGEPTSAQGKPGRKAGAALGTKVDALVDPVKGRSLKVAADYAATLKAFSIVD